MKQAKSKMITVIISVIVLILVIVTFSGYFYVKKQLEAKDLSNHKKIIVNIPKGSNVREIADILEEKQVINDSQIFSFYVKYKNEKNLKAGRYALSQSMDTSEIVSMLKKGKTVPQVALTIPESYSLDQIAERIVYFEPRLNKNEVLKVMDDPQFIAKMMAKYPDILTKDIHQKNIRHPLEGYLYPATYSFKEKAPSTQTILEQMIKATDDHLKKYLPELKKKKKSVHQLLTMASIIEKEATKKTDRKKIASVFHNRLTKNMPFEAESTVLYALSKHKTHTFHQDINVESPYNTYKNKGLPPGPIANSGESSLEAALEPAKTDYLYFLVNNKTGKIDFSSTNVQS